jgi:hypothetical protein
LYQLFQGELSSLLGGQQINKAGKQILYGGLVTVGRGDYIRKAFRR